MTELFNLMLIFLAIIAVNSSLGIIGFIAILCLEFVNNMHLRKIHAESAAEQRESYRKANTLLGLTPLKTTAVTGENPPKAEGCGSCTGSCGEKASEGTGQYL